MSVVVWIHRHGCSRKQRRRQTLKHTMYADSTVCFWYQGKHLKNTMRVFAQLRPCKICRVRRASNVAVSPGRLDEFLKAEISFLARTGYSSIKIEQILEHRLPADVANVINKELRARFADRIRQIESTRPQWRKIPGMREAHQVLSTSFRNLRLVNYSEDDLSDFSEMIVD